MKITQGLVEQHIHGAFGIDFMQCSVEEVLQAADMLSEKGVTAFFPAIMTDDTDTIKERINIIKQAKSKQKKHSAQIIGIHLEGPFINPEKAGIHEKKYILPLNKDLFKKIEDDIIKIITIAPELDLTGEFLQYLKSKNIKISAGHTLASDLSKVNQVTHLYNAMGAFSHRDVSTVVSALYDDIYTEIIADSLHVSDKVLALTFKIKNIEKLLLISDALPLAHCNKKEHIFAGQKIYNKEGKLVNEYGTIAGSSSLLCDIIKNLADKNLLKFEDAVKAASSNQMKYHNINNNLKVYWNNLNQIEKTEFI